MVWAGVLCTNLIEVATTLALFTEFVAMLRMEHESDITSRDLGTFYYHVGVL